MNFYVTILGSGAAVPTLGRHCSSQVVNINGFKMLVDCGESTQNQLRACRQKMQSFGTIFLSHLHGDHIFGLPGLLASMHMGGRTEPVTIFAPPGLREALELFLKVSDTRLDYELIVKDLVGDTPVLIFENKHCKVTAFPLEHSVPCYGFLFEENITGLNLIPGVRDKYKLVPIDIAKIKEGADYVTPEGEVIPNAMLTMPRRRPLRYAYCCDTAYTETILPVIKEVDLLCVESTFDQSRVDLAAQRRHCTTLQAAELADKANAKQLMLTHFSARYKVVESLLDESRSVFPNTIAASDGLVVELKR